VGDSDKYIETILIVKKERRSTIKTECVLVNENTFNCLIKYLSEQKGMGVSCKDSLFEHGSFRVKILNKGKEDCYITVGRKKSLHFFLGIKEYLDRDCVDKNLSDILNAFIIQNINKTPPIGSGYD